MTGGLVIVGAGVCGVSAAFAARECGYRGPVTLIGNEPEWPYERPPLSKWDDDGPSLRLIYPPASYEEAGITLMRATKVSGIDAACQTVATERGESIAFDRLLLATGAAARNISLTHLTNLKPHYLRSYRDALNLASQMAEGTDTLIIGGGFIGLELAASLAARRCFVHVIEQQDRILARALPDLIAQKIENLHKRHGVTIHGGTQLVSLKDGIADLSNGLNVRVGKVIAGVGSAPRTELADAAGLATDNGITVDAEFRTSAPNIFAAGDCCAAPLAGFGRVRLESWQVAADHGRRAGQVIAGKTPEDATPPWFWSDQYDHSLQSVGWPPTDAAYIPRVLPDGGLLCIAQAPDGQIVHAAGVAPGHQVGRQIKLIQRIMQAGIAPDPQDLMNSDMPLKSILKQNRVVLADIKEPST